MLNIKTETLAITVNMTAKTNYRKPHTQYEQ